MTTLKGDLAVRQSKGHIGIHLSHRNDICGKKKRKLPIRIMKWIFGVVGMVILAVVIFITGSRNINYIKHYELIKNGIDEGSFISLGGQKQDPANETASFEQAEEDLDDLVDYAIKRFGQEKVIILGHSYGTILGSIYAREHPEKVMAYIGAAQVVSLEKMDIVSYEDALSKAKAAGDDIAALENAYEEFKEDGSITNMMNLRHLTSAYHPAAVPDRATMMAIQSPYFGVDDFRWFLKQLGDIDLL